MDFSLPTIDKGKAVVLAGFLGSLLSLSFLNGLGHKRRIVALIFGGISSHYFTPPIAFLFNEDNYQETIGFLVGLFGMSIIAAIFRAIESSDIWGLIRSRYGGKNEQNNKRGGKR